MPSHLHPLCTPRASSFTHQRLLWCIRGSNRPWSEFVCGRGSSVSTKRGSKQHRHRPRRTKISNMSLVQHADPGCSKQPFSRAFRIYPIYPPYGTHSGHKSGNNDDSHGKSTELAHLVPSPRDIGSNQANSFKNGFVGSQMGGGGVWGSILLCVGTDNWTHSLHSQQQSHGSAPMSSPTARAVSGRSQQCNIILSGVYRDNAHVSYNNCWLALD